MDGWLKALVAAAALAVMSPFGLWGWSEVIAPAHAHE